MTTLGSFPTTVVGSDSNPNAAHSTLVSVLAARFYCRHSSDRLYRGVAVICHDGELSNFVTCTTHIIYSAVPRTSRESWWVMRTY